MTVGHDGCNTRKGRENVCATHVAAIVYDILLERCARATELNMLRELRQNAAQDQRESNYAQVVERV